MMAVAKRDKFPKVIAAIDDLIAGLKVQQKEEVDHKKWCEESKHENEMTTHQKNTTLEGVEAKIADAKNQLEAVADEMAATQKALAEGPRRALLDCALCCLLHPASHIIQADFRRI